MRLLKFLAEAAGVIQIVDAVYIPSNIPPDGFRDHVTKFEPQAWNFANSTTADAKADGSVGVIIEPDLVEGVPGKDGAIIKKIKFGPYTLQPGQKQEYPIGLWGPSLSAGGRELPCYDCYITAMQLNLEYLDGTTANVDTGAWYGF
jgi:hypothetical protein